MDVQTAYARVACILGFQDLFSTSSRRALAYPGAFLAQLGDTRDIDHLADLFNGFGFFISRGPIAWLAVRSERRPGER